MIENMLAIKQLATFSMLHPMQLALAEGILEYPEYYKNLHKLYKKQNQLLRENLKGSPFQILDYSEISNQDDDKFASNLIKEYGVGLVTISSLFGTPKNGLLRLCFAKKDNDINQRN